MSDRVAIVRRKSRQIHVGKVPVGGGAPISVQSMTNQPTADVPKTVEQIRRLEAAGAEIVRCSCPDADSTRALRDIVRAVNVPIIADIHFHYQRAIEAAVNGAACLRINPGNIGSVKRVREVIRAAKDYGLSMRIGVNAGSLEQHLLEKYGGPTPEALIESALKHVKVLEDNDFVNFKISVKASDILLMISAYQGLAKACEYPLHIGVTESGGLRSGTVKSAMGIGTLLWGGIGDTLRVSLSTDPVEEVKVGFEILRGLGIRSRGVHIVSCPSCARQGFDVVGTVAALEERLAHITIPMKISILGCVVNGPGEAQSTTIGLTGGGNKEHMIYLNGSPAYKIGTPAVVDHVVALVEANVAQIQANRTGTENNEGRT